MAPVVPPAAPHQLSVTKREHIAGARREARRIAGGMGFPPDEVEMVVLATVELATNLVRYGIAGVLSFRTVQAAGRSGIEVRSDDRGPGIADLDLAMTDGFSTSGGLGGGLPAVRRLMDEFAITSRPQGTHVMCRKWLPRS